MLRTTFAVALSLLSLGASASAETLRAVTAANLSPFSRGADEALPGFVHEYAVAVAEAAGYELEIEYVPWKRAQEMAQKEPNLLVFGLTRNEAREPLYSWGTNMVTVERVFLTTSTPINSIEEAAGLDRIAARSVYFRSLEGLGWTNVEEGETHANFKKLKAGRVDAVFTVSSRAVFVWTEELGFDRSELVVGEGLRASDIWLGASLGYSPEVIAKLDAANAKLRADGTYAELYAKYFGDLEILPVANPDQKPSATSS